MNAIEILQQIDTMSKLNEMQNEICAQEKELYEKKKELKHLWLKALESEHGENYGCNNCAYGCCVDVIDLKSVCVGRHNMNSNRCDKYLKENKLSKYMKAHYYYKSEILDALEILLEEDDILRNDEACDKALQILKIVNGE